MGSTARSPRTKVPSRRTVSIADCSLDLETAELCRGGTKTTLQEQPFQILTALLETPGQLVTREELTRRLWPSGTFVDFDQSLNKAVNRLREVLGDSADEPRFIETLPRRGYRLIAPVEIAAGPASSEDAAADPQLPESRESGTNAGGTVSRGTNWRWLAAAVAAVILILVLAKLIIPPPPATLASSTAVAVLPFQNSAADKDIDYLRFALPDEIAAALSYAPSVSIRPSAVTSKYVGPDLDLQKAGREMHVAEIVTGHYLKEGDRLHVVLEGVDVENNRVIWRDTVTTATPDMIGMQQQIAGRVRSGLLPALRVSATPDWMTHPRDEKAYDAYLRSIPISRDPGINHDAIVLLESSVAADPNFAPAWEALGLRYHYAASFENGGKEMVAKSDAAYQRALELDPNRIVAAGELITNLAERRELVRAYKVARKLLNSHPNSAQAHYVLGYVYRYAGKLDESAKECDTALGMDPGNFSFRTCAWTFTESGNPGRARDFLQLDAGSDFAAYGMVTTLIDEGRLAEARSVVQTIASNPSHFRDLLGGCLQPTPPANLDSMARDVESSLKLPLDPEIWYYQGAILVFCGKQESGARLLASAIHANYCAKTALQTDPLLAKIRGTAQYEELQSAASECQQRFAAGSQ
jgi:DNA-binding winged helix-turn-helix (wHTH) protein/TolB-like protein